MEKVVEILQYYNNTIWNIILSSRTVICVCSTGVYYFIHAEVEEAIIASHDLEIIADEGEFIIVVSKNI